MKDRTILYVILAVIIIALVFVWWQLTSSPGSNIGGNVGTSTTQQTATSTSTFDHSVSDGTITFLFPSTDFGLATNATQVTTQSYIPSCDTGFNYCLYYIGSAYSGTNFESAGIRIQERPDLANERLCLETPPTGFDASFLPTATAAADAYSGSVFSNVGNGAAGHISQGALYRLFVRKNSSCYEFETRIGQSQFGNYPAGSIKEFTSTDVAQLDTELKAIIDNVSLPDGTNHLFPAP